MGLDVSVIIPTFRRRRELAEALSSVLGQDDVEFEIFVVDDCPEWSAMEVVSMLGDPRITYIRNPDPSGGRPGLVRNLAWPDASGDLVHFLDDDDRVPPGHYGAMKAVFAQRPGVGVAFGRVEPFGSDRARVEQEHRFFRDAARRAARAQRYGRRWGFVGRMCFDPTLLVCGAALIRRECVEAIGGFNPDLQVMEDVDFYTRAIRRFGACYVDRVALHYRVGPSLMRQPDVQDLVDQSYARMHADYRMQWGSLDFLALKLFTRSILAVS